MALIKTSFSSDDVTVLLKDLSGHMTEIDTLEREKMIQGGTHYSEMLPKEYTPSQKYLQVYNDALLTLSEETACAVARLSQKLLERHGKEMVLVSLARAGTPIGVLVKRYFKQFYQMEIPHYSVSIIRGKGIDINALKTIVHAHGTKGIQFLDGWVGKGAINNELDADIKRVKLIDNGFEGLSSALAVLSDPAYITDLCGTHQDFLIPSACLNATVSGLFSRTIHRSDLIGSDDYHGAVYYADLEDTDQSLQFIKSVEGFFGTDSDTFTANEALEIVERGNGIKEATEIAEFFKIKDINWVKPGVGETTRVLLRRLPWKVLVNFETANPKYIQHILQLCQEKGVEAIHYPLKTYSVCGLIKNVSDV